MYKCMLSSLAALLLVTGCGMTSNASTNTTDLPTARVRTGQVADAIVATGVVRTEVGAEINVGSRVSGTVLELPVQVGDEVSVGQVLARLDPTPLAADLERAEANLALAIPSVALAENTLERTRLLVDRGLVSAQDLDRALRDVAVEKAREQVARANLKAARIDPAASLRSE